MFVALRDLRFAKGRFALMITVIVLVSLLVGFLSALTGGLARASTSAITDLPADRLAFSTPAGAEPDFTSSSVTLEDVAAWGSVAGVEKAQPLGITTARASVGAKIIAVTAIGVESGSELAPSGAHSLGDHQVVLSRAASEELGDPESLSIGSATFTTSEISESDVSLSHTPVVWVSLDDWQALGSAGQSDDPVATVVAIDGAPSGSVDDMTVRTLQESRSAVGSFSSENGSLRTISGFLVAISALVIGAFFSVWTVGRVGDIAVLKALGASSRYLLRDAIGQAAIVLLIGVGTGTSVAALAAWLLSSQLPVVLAPATFVVPAGLLILAGLLGAAAAVARITRIDPHAALAAR